MPFPTVLTRDGWITAAVLMLVFLAVTGIAYGLSLRREGLLDAGTYVDYGAFRAGYMIDDKAGDITTGGLRGMAHRLAAVAKDTNAPMMVALNRTEDPGTFTAVVVAVKMALGVPYAVALADLSDRPRGEHPIPAKFHRMLIDWDPIVGGSVI
jgi:hypothetical protein